MHSGKQADICFYTTYWLKYLFSDHHNWAGKGYDLSCCPITMCLCRNHSWATMWLSAFNMSIWLPPLSGEKMVKLFLVQILLNLCVDQLPLGKLILCLSHEMDKKNPSISFNSKTVKPGNKSSMCSFPGSHFHPEPISLSKAARAHWTPKLQVLHGCSQEQVLCKALINRPHTNILNPRLVKCTLALHLTRYTKYCVITPDPIKIVYYSYTNHSVKLWYMPLRNTHNYDCY